VAGAAAPVAVTLADLIATDRVTGESVALSIWISRWGLAVIG
jgi:hypothetical protein